MGNRKQVFVWLCILCQFCICCISCEREKAIPGSYVTIDINNASIDSTKDISRFINSIEITPLNEKQGNLLGSIYQLRALKNYYVIFDLLDSKRINIFSKKGDFIKTLIQEGPGPDEGLNITDCWVNSANEVEVYDFALHQISIFDSLLHLVRKIKGDTSYLYSHIAQIPDSKDFAGLVNYNYYNPPFRKKYYSLDILDSNILHVLQRFMPFDRKLLGVLIPSFYNSFFLYNSNNHDSLRLIKPFDYFIYDLTPNGIYKRYKINYKLNSESANEKLTQIINSNLQKFKDGNISPTERLKLFKNISYSWGDWLENEKYIFLNSIYNHGEHSESFNSLIDKRNNYLSYSSKFFCYKSDGVNVLLPRMRAYDKYLNQYIGYSSGYQLKKLILKGDTYIKNINPIDSVMYLFKVTMK